MESWITILLTLALMIISAVVKSKEKNEKQAKNSIIQHIEEEENIDVDYFEQAASLRAEESVINTPNRFDTIGHEEFQAPKNEIIHKEKEILFEEKEVSKEKIRVDAKKMIIYSELLKPKFLEN